MGSPLMAVVEQEGESASEVLMKQKRMVILDLEEADRPLMNGCAERDWLEETRTLRTMTQINPILFANILLE